MNRLRRAFAFSAFLIMALLTVLPSVTNAQGLASLNGTVTDTSGATVPGANVKLENTRTGAVLTTQTASDGGYRFVDVQPGPGYAITVTKDGFQTYVLNGVYLPTATATTKDAQLTLGQVSQTVEVTAQSGSVSLNTTDATISNNLDMHAVENLPDEFRDTPGNLLRLAVGVTSAQTTAGNAITSNIDPNHTRDGAVAGARADQNNISVDGIEATDFALGQAFNVEASVGVDAIQEFSTQVAEPSASYGGRSGAQTILTTKSGTNEWHGSAYEYNRTAATEANTFFNKLANQPRLALVRNQFGGNLGGPVVKDKLFFFFEYDGRRDASAESLLQFVPYPHVRNGSIAYINNNAGCDGSARLTSADVSTNCVTILPAAQVAALDPCSTAGACAAAPGFVQAGQAPALANIFKTRYPSPNDYSVGDGLNTAGLRFNAPSPLTENGYVARVDYNFSSNNKMFGRFNLRNESTVNNNPGFTPIQFPGDALTALQTLRDRAWVFGDTWTVSPNVINQFTYGETRANDAFPTNVPAAGSLYALTFFGSSQNDSFATPFVRQGSSGRVIPDPTFRDDVTWTHGTHTFQFGAQWNPGKVRSYLVNDLTFIQEGLGGDITGLDNPGGGASAWRPSNILAADNTNWDNFFLGDLGIIWNYQNSINYTNSGTALPPGSTATRDWRITNIAGYFQDSWRARPDLTITGGLRYQFQGAPYEVHGTEAQYFNTTVDQILQARQSAGALGESGLKAVPLMTYVLAGKANNAPPLYSADENDFSPRLSLAWNPSFSDGFLGKAFGEHKTVIRAGGGLIYDQSVAWAMTNFEDQSNYLFTNTVGGEFNQQKPTLFALENDPRMNSVSQAPFTITAPAFQKSETPFAVFNDGINPVLNTPYSITASFGIQRELPGGFQLETDYYGRFGRRLLLLADVGQAMDFTDGASKQTLSSAFTTLELDSRANNGAGLPVSSVPNQPVIENQMNAAIAANAAAFGGSNCMQVYGTSCTANVYSSQFSSLQQGATGEIFASIPLPTNVGLTPQFFVNAPVANKGFSSYNGLFVILRKRLSDGLQFDFNYTYSHSIDNGSTISNENGNFEPGDTSVMCDVTNNRACRGSSEFDLTHQVSVDFVYELPFGHGQRFANSSGRLLNEAIGGWQISGIESWHSGFAYTVNNTDIAFYDTVSLAADTGMLLTGSKAPLKADIHMDPSSGSVQFYKDPDVAAAQFSPVTGLQSGSRDVLRGPGYSNLDLSLAKSFALVGEKYKLRIQADAYNVLNHPNFGLPDTGVISGSFGVIRGQIGQEPSRVMQFAAKFQF